MTRKLMPLTFKYRLLFGYYFLFAVFLCVMIAVDVLGVPGLGIKGKFQEYRNIELADLELVTGLLGERISSWFAERRIDVSGLVESGYFRQANEQKYPDNRKLRRELDAFLRGHPDFISAVVLRPDGGLAYAAGAERGNIRSAADMTITPEEISRLTIPGYLENIRIILAKHENRLRLRIIRQLLSANEPGNIIGLLVAECDVERSLRPLLTYIGKNFHSHNLECVIASKQLGLSSRYYEKSPGNLQTRVVMPKATNFFPIELAMAGMEGPFDGKANDGRAIMGFRRAIRLDRGNKLALVLTIDTSSAMLPVWQRLYVRCMFWFALFAGGLMLHIKLTDMVTLPIRKLTDVAYQVEKGNLDARIASVDQTEIGRFGSIFNDMLDRLQCMNRNLEFQVSERTQELQCLYSRLNTLLSSITDIVMEMNVNGVYTWANSAGFAFFGDDVIGGNAVDYLDGNSEVPELFQHLSGTLVDVRFIECRQKRKDGEIRLLMCSFRAMRDEDGEIGSIIITASDITDLKQIEHALRNSEQALRNILVCMPVAIAISNKQGRIVFINNEFKSLFGYTELDLQTTDDWWIKAYPDENERCLARKIWKNDVKKSLSTGTHIESREYAVTCKNGDMRIVEITGLADDAGIMGVLLDKTEQNRAEELLREANEKFSVAFDNAPLMIGISSLDAGVYIDVNRKFHELTQYDREEIIGKSAVELGILSQADRERMMEVLDRDGWLSNFELNLRNKAGETLIVKHWGKIITISDKKYLLSTVLDVSEQRKMELQFAQAQKMESIGRLAGGVAHDFNNMLGIILGHVELALFNLSSPDALREYLMEIKDAANRSVQITRQLLAFARRQPVDPKVLDLNEAVAGMLKMLRRLIGEDIELSWKPGYNLGKVRMDPGQLDQILANLCVNSRDAITGIGIIEIETENAFLNKSDLNINIDVIPGRYVMLALKDSGCGIGSDSIKYIFEPFYTTKDCGRGTGLGLSTVFGVVKQNKGYITVHSEPGNGTVFRIYFPVEDNSVEKLPTKTKTLAGGDETILLVEDEEKLLKLGTAMLARLGYSVIPANSPEQAIAVVEKCHDKIHLLITDVIMPEMNGCDLAAIIASHIPDLRCMYMSGYTSDVMAGRGNVTADLCLLRKPFSIEALAVKVRNTLDRKPEQDQAALFMGS